LIPPPGGPPARMVGQHVIVSANIRTFDCCMQVSERIAFIGNDVPLSFASFNACWSAFCFALKAASSSSSSFLSFFGACNRQSVVSESYLQGFVINALRGLSLPPCLLMVVGFEGDRHRNELPFTPLALSISVSRPPVGSPEHTECRRVSIW
jgi:hypothetical protein